MARSQFLRMLDASAITSDNARWFVFLGDRFVVVEQGGAVHLPDTAALALLGLQPEWSALLGTLADVAYFVGALPNQALPSTLQLVDLRQAYGLLTEQEYSIAGYAAQIAFWERTSRFCPVCATPTEPVNGERAKRCPACEFIQYPRISPAIIVLIHRPGQVLLTRKAEWPRNRYSLIAGFVEPGESLESCLHREVAEEVGVTVDSIRYLGSQPWPFPHQLMIGFTARYVSGDLTIDTQELEHAAWFDVDALPHLPPPQSIARRILDWHLLAQRDPAAPFPADPFIL